MQRDRDTWAFIVVAVCLVVWLLWQKHTSPEETQRREAEVRRRIEEKDWSE